MRIEILVDGSVEPQIYPLDKPKMTIGSGETCDIVISNDNISRKHLMIINENDAFYVVDQGSTNGSYINEERLVPGRRTEFTSFFPVRLGDLVLITLLSDADQVVEGEQNEPLIPLYPKEPPAEVPGKTPNRGADESTKMISLADLKKAKTSDLQAKRQEIQKKRSAPQKKTVTKTKRAKENQNFKFMSVVILIVVGAVGYYNIKTVKEEAPVKRMGDVVSVGENAGKKSEGDKNPAQNSQPVQGIPAEEPRLVSDQGLIEKSRYLQLLSDAKCVTDMEKYFCDTVPGANGSRFGVVQIGTTMHILVDGAPYFNEARRIVVQPPKDANGNMAPELEAPYNKTVTDTAVALYFYKGWPKNIDYEKIKDLKISVGLFDVSTEEAKIPIVAVIYPEMIKKYQNLVIQQSIENVREIGENALNFTKEFYKTY